MPVNTILDSVPLLEEKFMKMKEILQLEQNELKSL